LREIEGMTMHTISGDERISHEFYVEVSIKFEERAKDRRIEIPIKVELKKRGEREVKEVREIIERIYKEI